VVHQVGQIVLFTTEFLAERVRFELTGLSSSGFQDRRNRPLCHLSARGALVSLPNADGMWPRQQPRRRVYVAVESFGGRPMRRVIR
jgi:hypothetical protein